MDLAELQKTWKSPLNDLPAPERTMLVTDFARRMIRRRRFRSIWLATTFLWLALATAAAARAVVLGRTDSLERWCMFALLLPPWGLAIHFLRHHLRPEAGFTSGQRSVRESVAGELGDTRTGMRRMQWIGLLQLVMIPLLALVVRHLHAVGKVSSRELMSLSVFIAIVLSVSAAGMAWRYFGCLSRRRDRLEGILRLCDEA
ncbi:hypothetical protein OKA04_12490 [Luteolibacter flavescens]|uniref:DUF2868 domain-containing protein n=1 Tax=Luteolibacter flavescens TaxID=1859460 RepID=A0ABT3FPQ4_9BACT|nr:hypothetical protein [Luteolibacter flavescens]MCW1885549.1 hypothetical protein [Luteolibacter flavescens]